MIWKAGFKKLQIFFGVTDCFGTFICPPFRQLIYCSLCGLICPNKYDEMSSVNYSQLLSFSRCWVNCGLFLFILLCMKLSWLGMMSLNTKWSISRCWVTDSQPWSRVGQRQELLFWRRVTHSLFGGPSSHLCFLQSGNLCVEDQLDVQLVPSSVPSLVPSSLGH